MRRDKQAKVTEVAVNEQAIHAAQQDAMAVATLEQSHAQAAASLGEMLVYEKPYVEEEVLKEAIFHYKTAQEHLLKFGQHLCIIRANTTGNFQTLLETHFEISLRSAQLLMQATRRIYSNPQLEAHANAFAQLGQRKMLDLLTLADHDVLAIANNAEAENGLTFDEIDRMTTREFKAKIKELKQQMESQKQSAEAKDRLIAKKDARINELEEKNEQKIRELPDVDEREMHAEIAAITHSTVFGIRSDLHDAFEELVDFANVNETTTPDQLRLVFAGPVAQLRAALDDLCSKFDIPTIAASDAQDVWPEGEAEEE